MSGKGDKRRPQRVGDDVMADNWMEAFGGKWQCQTLEGEPVGVASTYNEARDLGLQHFPVGEDFAVVRVEG